MDIVVAPAELESVLSDHPAVEDSGVLGVYDEAEATELPRSVIHIFPHVCSNVLELPEEADIPCDDDCYVEPTLFQETVLS